RHWVINRSAVEIREAARGAGKSELPDDLLSSEHSTLELAIRDETYERYTAALSRLRPKDRQLVVAGVEAQWTMNDITAHFGFATSGATHVAVGRALKRLRDTLAADSSRGVRMLRKLLM